MVSDMHVHLHVNVHAIVVAAALFLRPQIGSQDCDLKVAIILLPPSSLKTDHTISIPLAEFLQDCNQFSKLRLF